MVRCRCSPSALVSFERAVNEQYSLAWRWINHLHRSSLPPVAAPIEHGLEPCMMGIGRARAGIRTHATAEKA